MDLRLEGNVGGAAQAVHSDRDTAAAHADNPRREEETACGVCGANVDGRARLRYLERQFSHVPAMENPFAALDVLVCPRCGFGWALPSIDQARLEAFYRRAYRGSGSSHHVSDPTGKTLSPFEPRAVSQLLLARMFRRFAPGEAVLDVGPGYGESFGALARLIPHTTLFAFEPDPAAAQFLRDVLGVHVFPHPFPAGPHAREVVDGRMFHLVLMSHVLEHFNGEDVIAVLENVRRILSDGGLLVCEVPYCDLRRHADLRTNDTPHLAFFSAESLRVALVRAGFIVRFLETCSQPYDAWWAGQTAGRQRATRCLAEPAAVRWAKQGYKALHCRLPRDLRRRLDVLWLPARIEALLRSDELDYGGERTCLRAVASREP